MIHIDLRKLKILAMITLSLPVVIFLFGWVKFAIALPLTLLIAASVYRIIKGYDLGNKLEEKENTIQISRGGFFFLIFIAMLWCFWAGQGGFFHQTEDHNFRNAVFRDLINMPWPVHYEPSHTALVYYFTYWMIPASIGKASLLLVGAEQAWLIGNIFLFFWTSFLVLLTFLLLIANVKVTSLKGIVLATLIFVFFSGMDIVGLITVQHNQTNDLEWWAYFYQYSANTTQLFWVFNQSTPTWVLMLLLLQEKNVQNYAFIGFLIFAFAPIPFIGALVFLLAGTIAHAIKSYKAKQGTDFLRKLFSMQNIVAVLLAFPVFALFFSASSAISGSESGGPLQIYVGQDVWPLGRCIFLYVLFLVLEFAFYACIILKDNIKNRVFWVSVLSLVFIGMFQLSGKVDFAMRASIPALMAMVVFIIVYIKEHLSQLSQRTAQSNKLWFKKIVLGFLVIALVIGGITPLIEFTRAVMGVQNAGKPSAAVEDNIKTLSSVNPDGTQTVYAYFMSSGYYDSSFVKFLAKEGK